MKRRKPGKGKRGDAFGCALRSQVMGGSSYRERDATLRNMGFENYTDYLRSALWAGIRDGAFRLKGKQCFLCGGVAVQIHHQRYDPKTLKGKLKHLYPVCAECHRNVEHGPDGKRTLPDSRLEFDRLRALYRSRMSQKKREAAKARKKAHPIPIVRWDEAVAVARCGCIIQRVPEGAGDDHRPTVWHCENATENHLKRVTKGFWEWHDSQEAAHDP